MSEFELQSTPIVYAVRILQNGRANGELEVVCPYCDRLHYHQSGNSPGEGNGHRAAACTHPANRPGYILLELGSREGRSPLRHAAAYAEPHFLDRVALVPGGLRPRRSPVSVATRARVLERDDFRCRRCGTGPRYERLVVDHITPVALGGSSDDDNLQTLCEHDLERR